MSFSSLNSRNINLDLARSFAICSIVLCHCTEFTYQLTQESWSTSSTLSQYVRTILFTLGRLGVPIFLMLSGFLLLQRHKMNNFDDYKVFIKRKWFPLLICSQVWIIIYYIYNLFFNVEIWSFKNLISQLMFFSLPRVPHWWYIPMIIGIYLLIPLIKYLNDKLSSKFIIAWFSLSFLTVIILPALKLNLKVDLSYLGDCYVFCVLLGYITLLIHDKKIELKRILLQIKSEIIKDHIVNPIYQKLGLQYRRNTEKNPDRYGLSQRNQKLAYMLEGGVIILILFIAFFSITITQQINAYKKGNGYNVWYNAPFLILSSSSLFVFFNFIKINGLPKLLKLLMSSISICSFGIYLVHCFFLFLFAPVIKKIGWPLSLSCVVLFLAVFLFSYIFVFFTSKTIIGRLYLIKNK